MRGESYGVGERSTDLGDPGWRLGGAPVVVAHHCQNGEDVSLDHTRFFRHSVVIIG